ncbi:MAG: agmatine deiminase family protein [Aggregatilineales bacterium]
MPKNTNAPLQFNYIPYPLWRRRTSALLQSVVEPVYKRVYPVAEDRNPPQTAERMAAYLARFGLLGTDDEHTIQRMLEGINGRTNIERASTDVPASNHNTPKTPLRIPAQWEPMEAVIVNFPILYPPLWELHAQMIEGIVPVARVTVTVPTEMWACAAWLYLQNRAKLDDSQLENIKFLILPTDDIWVRDYGPIIGYDADGARVALDAHYERQKPFGNLRDDNMPILWAAHTETPLISLDLNTEGGNLWSDGQGTLIMSNVILEVNPAYDRAALERYLHNIFDYEKLILTPRMAIESTGHIDLLLKLADPETVLVSAPTTRTSAQRLRDTADLFRRETNAQNQPYRVIELPTPSLYLNWLAYPIRRSYTNALTVNGRVLVPVYGLNTDEEALRIYAETMPDYEIIPIDCEIGANGGGAVHCMTKEVPVRR